MIQNIRIPKSSLELNITVHSDARNYIKGDDGMEASDYNTTEAYFEMEINSTDDHGNMSGSHDQLITETVTVETSHHSDTHVALAETTTAETPADHHLHTTDHSTQDSEHQNVTEMIETVNDTMESITSDHSIDHPVDQNSTNHTNVETILDTTTTIDNGTFETETSTEAGMTTDHFSNGTAEVLDEAMNETSANETTTSEPQFANLIQPNDESEPHLTTVINHEVERETHNETTAIVVTSSSKKPCGMLPSEHEVHNNTQKHD